MATDDLIRWLRCNRAQIAPELDEDGEVLRWHCKTPDTTWITASTPELAIMKCRKLLEGDK